MSEQAWQTTWLFQNLVSCQAGQSRLPKPSMCEKRWVVQECIVHVMTVTAIYQNYVNLKKEFDFVSILNAQTQVGLWKLHFE